MLTISNEQMVALTQSLTKRFGREVVADLKHSAPDSIQGLDNSEIDARLDTALRKCAQYKLEAKRDIRAYIRLCFVVGPNFDLYPPFLNTLKRLHVPAQVRLERLFGSATDVDWNNAAICDIVSRWRDGSHQETVPKRAESPRSQKENGLVAGVAAGVSLELLRPEHADFYFLQSRHPDVWRLGGLRPLRSVADTREYLISVTADPNRSAFAIVADGLGFVGGLGMRWREDEIRIHYWVGRPFWGRGVATGALQLALAAPARDAEVFLCTVSINHENLPSFAVARKCGFEVERTNWTHNTSLLRYAKDARGEVENM